MVTSGTDVSARAESTHDNEGSWATAWLLQTYSKCLLCLRIRDLTLI